MAGRALRAAEISSIRLFIPQITQITQIGLGESLKSGLNKLPRMEIS